MDIQFQEFIEKLKRDGIASAEIEAARVNLEAETKAKEIVEAAQKKATIILETAKETALHTTNAGIAAIEQASRNLLISFKVEIEELLKKIVLKDETEVYDKDLLKKIIPKVIEGFVLKSGSVDVVLNEKDLSSLSKWAQKELSLEISKGIEIKAGKSVGTGFRIREKDGSAYYDFSASAVTEALCGYLNPVLAGILKDAVKEA
jgi:V/A-type H+-transporting ATPase subunit E